MSLEQASQEITQGPHGSLSTLPASDRHWRWAFVVWAVLLIAFLAAAPFARVQLPQSSAFVVAVHVLLVTTNLVTAYLLYGQFAIFGGYAILALASGYLFAGLVIIPYSFAFPGAVTPTGLFGSLQSTPWLNIFWHVGFAIAATAYALLKDVPRANDQELKAAAAIGYSLALVAGLAGVVTWICIDAEAWLPTLFVSNVRGISNLHYYAGFISLSAAVALIVLWRRRRTVLDVWLLIALWAEMSEPILAAILNSSRFTIGFYSSRVFSVVTSTVVLVVLLAETTRLYAELSRSNMRLRREQSNRLMNLEAMTASIAHEVKQPLTALVANAGAAQRWIDRTPPKLDEAREALNDVIEDSVRVSQVFDNIRALFRRGSKEEAIDLNQLAQHVLDTFADEFKKHRVATRVELSSALPRVVGHGGQLQEVLLNLVQNAVEAMDAVAEDGRLLQLRTEHDGDRITLTVKDSGPGFDEKILNKLFNTFISTKSSGMGLGLAISRMIIERHGGEISAAMAEPRGAVFRVDLLAGKWPPQAAESRR